MLVLDPARESLVSSSGGVLLGQTIAVSGLARSLSAALSPWRSSRAVHDPGKVLVDVASAVALGGDCLADVAVIGAQPEVFGPVASDPTVSRLVADLAGDVDAAVAAIRSARAAGDESGVDIDGDLPARLPQRPGGGDPRPAPEPTLSAPGRVSPHGGERPWIWAARSMSPSGCCKTGSGCWGRTTPTLSEPVTTSPTRGGRRGIWSARSVRLSGCWAIGSGCWDRIIPTSEPSLLAGG